MARDKFKVPRAPSIGEETFMLHCRELGLSPEREYKFCEGRNWAFDFAFPEELIAVEVEGGTAFGRSRHSRGQGFVNDCLKYNMAARHGWKVLRFTTGMVQSAHAIDFVEAMINRRASCVDSSS